MGKIRLRKINLPKDKLDKIPDCERGVFIYSGHITNEINWLSKLMLFLQQSGREFADNLPNLTVEERAIHEGHTAQILIVLKLLAGKNHETVLFLRRWCFEMPWFENLSKTLPAEAQTGLAGLKKYLQGFEDNPKSSLLKLVRDKSAFHYDDAAVKASMSASTRVEEITTYLADTVGNTLYLGSEFAVADFLIEKANQGQAAEVLEKLMKEAQETSRWIKDLLGHTMAALTVKYFGDTIQDIGHQADIEIDASLLEYMRLPYYFDSNRKK